MEILMSTSSVDLTFWRFSSTPLIDDNETLKTESINIPELMLFKDIVQKKQTVPRL